MYHRSVKETPAEDSPFVISPFPAVADSAAAKTSLTVRFIDGKPDLDGMRPAARERLKNLVADPEFQAKYNLQPGAEEGVIVDPQFVSSALDSLAALQTQIIAVKYEIPYNQAAKIAAYTDPEKQMLIPPAQRVLGKRAPDFIKKYGDELILAITLANIARVKFSFAAKLSEEIKKAKEPMGEASPGNGNPKIEDHSMAAAVISADA
jgi:hypothetical protein